MGPSETKRLGCRIELAEEERRKSGHQLLAHTPGGTDIATSSHTRSDLEAGFASRTNMGGSHIEIAPSPRILEMSLEEQASFHLMIESFL